MTVPRSVLVTGGAGFIGSHTCVELLQQGHEVIVVDDYSNSSLEALRRVETISGRSLVVHELELRDRERVDAIFKQHDIEAVIHFAAKKAVGESVEIPLEYYDINVGGTIVLLRTMAKHGIKDLVFSSSCSVYGDAQSAPLTEDDATAPTNPYARTKLMCEQLLGDACARDEDLGVIALRYFNPVGAHPSGELGEEPNGLPRNLMPYLMQVAAGRLEKLSVFGDDYPTVDGTCVRDYIHVVDVADGHRVALDHLGDSRGLRVLNLGTGVGTSVLELVAAYQAACGIKLPYQVVGRRPGDVPKLVADPSRVAREWNWRTTRNLADMCADSWRFQQLNPAGYLP